MEARKNSGYLRSVAGDWFPSLRTICAVSRASDPTHTAENAESGYDAIAVWRR